MGANTHITEQQANTSNALVNESVRNDTTGRDIKQYSTFDKSFQHATTFNSGKVIPIAIQEVYPADIYDIDIDALIRLSAQKSTPFMNINIDVSVFFVPYNQLDKDFKQLMGESNEYGYSDTNIEFPQLEVDTDTFTYTENDIGSYLGIPINTKFHDSKSGYSESLNLYPFIAYGKIINEWYRDQNLQSCIDITSVYKDDTRKIKASTYKPTMTYLESLIYGKGLAPSSKLPSFYTTNLPYQQKGNPIELGAFQLEDLYVTNTETGKQLNLFSPIVYRQDGAIMNTTDGQNHVLASNGQSLNDYTLASGTSRNTNPRQANLSLEVKAKGNPPPFNVMDLRDSLVMQHLLENFALCGSRYIEQLKSIWGINIDPKEINQTELIGGYNDTLVYNNITQTSQTTADSQLGNVASNLYNRVNTPHVSYAASQHGFIMVMLTIRTPINNGGQGLPKLYGYKTYLQLFNPMFNGISEQPTKNKEIYYNDVTFSKNDETFGFNEPFLSTKYNVDQASGFMSLRSKTSLFTKFLFGEKYDDTPVLSDQWIRYNENIIGNTLWNVSDATKEFYHQFVALFTFNIQYTTQQPLFNNPKVYGI